MAEPKKDGTEKSADEITVYNRGRRTYTTSAGLLTPNSSVTLPAKEAKAFLDYRDVVDFSKVAPKSKAVSKEVEDLKVKAKTVSEENEMLKSENKALKETVDQMGKAIADRDAQIAQLQQPVAEKGKGGKGSK